MIHCGFFVAQALHAKLAAALNENGVGVWPISDTNEQRLHLFTNEAGTIKKTYLITTLFSEQRKLVSEEIQKFFHETDNILNEPYEPPKPPPIRTTVDPKTREQQEALKLTTSQFKLWQEQFKQEHGRPPTLEEIRNNPRASQLLGNLSKRK